MSQGNIAKNATDLTPEDILHDRLEAIQCRLICLRATISILATSDTGMYLNARNSLWAHIELIDGLSKTANEAFEAFDQMRMMLKKS